MKFICSRSALQKILSSVGKAISAKGALPVLSNVYLRAFEDGTLLVSATDLEIGISCQTASKIEKPGEITVPYRIFSDLIGSIDEEEVTISLVNQQLKIETGRIQSKLSTLPAEEFPRTPPVPDSSAISLDAILLSKSLERVIFAAAADESRPILTGVLFKGAGNKLTLAAADGFRLSEQTLSLEQEFESDFTFVVPAKALREVIRQGKQSGDEKMELYLLPEENQVVFRLVGCEVSARLLDGTFPDYLKIIPSSFATTVVTGREGLLRSLRSAAIFAQDLANVVKLVVKPDSSDIVLSANTQDVGEGVVKVLAKVEGDGVEVAFNAKYMLDCLSNLDCEQVTLGFNQPLNPLMITPVGEGIAGYLHVIMPVRVQA